MGTQATACFYEMLHSLQSVAAEQEYIDVLLYSMPSIPDRTAYITGQSSESPLGSLTHAAQILESSGVSCIALPCATSHFFYSELAASVNIPILNMLDETAYYAEEQGFKKVCLLATDGTLRGGFFQAAFKKRGIEVITPAEGIQADIMDMIYEIKRGEAVSPDALSAIISKARDDGAETVVLGCTELCVIADSAKIYCDSINTLQVLAEASIAFCKKGIVK